MGDLRQEVARAIETIDPQHPYKGPLSATSLRDADAAIAVVLERAAQVAESGDWRDGTASKDERRIAAAIRSLAKEQQP